MAVKKLCLVIFGVLFCLLFTIYIKYFNHGPPEAIMDANRKKLEKRDGFKDTGDVFESLVDDKDKRTSYENDVDYEKDPVKSKRHWDNFISENKFVSIGEIYDKCEGKDRRMRGRTIMMADAHRGGVKSRTFFNITLEKELTSGVMNIKVKYNGNDLYEDYDSFCEMDKDSKERMVFCPLKPVFQSFTRENKIPKYLPKGRYHIKVWLTDQDKEVRMCAFCEFVL